MRNSSKVELAKAGIEPVAYTAAEVAAALSISYDTTLRLIKNGRIPSFRVGTQYRVHREHLIDVTRAASESGGDLLADPATDADR